MLNKSALALAWLGGTASNPALGFDARPAGGKFVNVLPEGAGPRRFAPHRNAAFTASAGANEHFAHQPEIRQAIATLPQMQPRLTRWNRQLRADIYDELLKLPLRFALHDLDRLQRHLRHVDEAGNDDGVYAVEVDGAREFYAVAGRTSTVGYAPPLGPADPFDCLPFFVHRSSNGGLPGTIHSMHPRNLMPAFYMRIQGVEGDRFRFEEELMKIFPTKKIFVRSHSVYVYNVAQDGRMVLHHWLLGLGF
ncbi:unnamed protein product [Phytomonas sp. EM1]|nr:unnamed protein product [Phytomonas sp. EM1]|eukprot:CCW60230.1 unnamed protein product [Phytomonas sp. isolate EM1]